MLCLEFFSVFGGDEIKHVFFNEITETRIYCGFRENMIQESTKPYRRSRVKLAWLIYSYILSLRIYELVRTENDL